MELAITLKATDDNPDVGDLYLDSTGNEVLLDDLLAEVAQRIQVRLSFFKGEWFLDLEQGTPYREHIFRVGPTGRIIRLVLGNVIRTTEGVETLRSFSYTFDRRARKLSVAFEVTCVNGQILKSTAFGRFVVPV